MGFALAETCAHYGAEVILISGPVNIIPEHPNIALISVQTAKQMLDECLSYFHLCDGAILSAAVADFSPEITYMDKVKREKESSWQLSLKPTIDIASTLGKQKRNKQVLAGFALETNNALENAKTKLKKKNFDFIVLNSLNDEGSGFGTDTNKITIIDKNNNIDKFELKSKMDVSVDIIEKLFQMMKLL